MTADRPTQLRADVDAAIAANDDVAARMMLERLWRERPGPATAGFVTSRASRLPPVNQSTATIAVLRSFTVEPVVPVLRAAGFVNGLDLVVHVGDFNTYPQEMLDPAMAVHALWNPDVVILAAQLRDVAPELRELFGERTAGEIDTICDNVIDQFTDLIEGFRRLNGATLVVHGFEEPAALALGVADRAAVRSQRATIRSLNERLTRLIDGQRDVCFLDYDALIARVGRDRWHDERKWQAMRMPIRADHLIDLADEWLRYIQPAIGRVAKALVVDLDNTLWGGVLGEDGIEGIRVGPDSSGDGYQSLQRSILDLRSRGILLGICSKNNHSDAMEALENHPEMLLRPDKFAAIRANWASKVDNLREIAAELNIGLDSVAFMDDSPFECELVRRELPDVTVIEFDGASTSDTNPLVGNPFFERLRIVDEDRNRAVYYTQQHERQEALEQSDSLERYLHSLRTRVVVSIATAREVERVAQLTQKTNQFNLTTRRYTENEIERFVGDQTSHVYVARADDRFGDHGLIGVLIVRTTGDVWYIDTMLLSCRVIGRGVETAMLAVVLDHGKRAGAATVVGTFVPTPKNAPAREFYATSGFEQVVPDDASADVEHVATDWQFVLGSQSLDVPAWIDIHTDDDGIHG